MSTGVYHGVTHSHSLLSHARTHTHTMDVLFSLVCLVHYFPPHTHRLLDNLPAAATDDNGTVIYTHGFPVGDIEPGNRHYFLYNHVKMTVKYHLAAEYKGARIVGFDVHPMRYAAVVSGERLGSTHPATHPASHPPPPTTSTNTCHHHLAQLRVLCPGVCLARGGPCLACSVFPCVLLCVFDRCRLQHPKHRVQRQAV
jgi:hypothetical protein